MVLDCAGAERRACSAKEPPGEPERNSEVTYDEGGASHRCCKFKRRSRGR